MKKLAKQVGSAKKQTMGSKLSYIKYKEKLAAVCFFPDAGTVTHNHIQVSSDGRTSDCI